MGRGWSASIQVTLFPHILLLFLTQGIGPLQSFHFSINWWNYHPLERITTSVTTLEGYHSLERIITSLSLPWGIITPWRGLSPLTRYPGGLLTPHLSNHYPGGLPTPTESDLSSPFPHNYSCSVVYFHSKGYGLGTLMARNCTEKNNSLAATSAPTLRTTQRDFTLYYNRKPTNCTAFYLSSDKIWYYYYALCTVSLTHVSNKSE